jgi:tRNA(fMet)-specific endonuclease VapC
MSGRFLLDTNIAIAIFAEESAVLERAAAVLGCDAVTAQQYGRIKNDLRSKGRPIPENDIWIAAVAVQHGLTVVSRDDHFAEVTDLPREVW